MRQGTQVVEEFREDGPAVILIPHRLADDAPFPLFDGVAQKEPLSVEADIAEPFVVGAAGVFGFGRTSEPPFVNTAAVQTERVPVGRRKFDSPARLAEDAGNPVRGQTKDPFARFHRRGQNRSDFVTFDFFGLTASSHFHTSQIVERSVKRTDIPPIIHLFKEENKLSGGGDGKILPGAAARLKPKNFPAPGLCNLQ